MNRPDPDFFWRSYEALGLLERRVMELKALIGAATSKSVFFAALRASGTSGPGGKSWTVLSLNPILEALTKQGLLNSAFVCAPALAHRLSRLVAESADRAHLVKGLERALPGSPREQKPSYYFGSRISDSDLFRRLRLAIYVNDAVEFVRLVAIFHGEDDDDRGASLSRFLCSLPADVEWLEGRSAPIRAAFAASIVSGFLDRGLDRGDLAAAVDILSREAAPSMEAACLLIRRALLAGAFDEAVSRANALAPEENHILAATHASIAFLTGDTARALAGFRDALKQTKKRLSKRRIVLDAEFGLLHVLALLQAHDATLHAVIRTLLDIGMSDGQPCVAAYVALEGLLHLAAGQESFARISAAKIAKLNTGQPLARALISLAEFALDRDAARGHEPRNKVDHQRIARLLPIAGLIHAQVLFQAGSQKEQWRDACLAMKDLRLSISPKSSWSNPCGSGPSRRSTLCLPRMAKKKLRTRRAKAASGSHFSSIRTPRRSKRWNRPSIRANGAPDAPSR